MTEVQFEKIFRELFTPLSNIAYSVLRDEDAAKDIVQQVFLKLWQKKDSIEIRGSVKSYLHRAVVNGSLNYIEKHKRIQLADTLIDEGMQAEADSKTKLSDEKIELEIKKAINELPDKCNLVFSLSRFSGMTNAEIADNLQISVKAVEKHIGKALKTLRHSLKPLYESLIILLLIEIYFDSGVGLYQLLLSY